MPLKKKPEHTNAHYNDFFSYITAFPAYTHLKENISAYI